MSGGEKIAEEMYFTDHHKVEEGGETCVQMEDTR
jgi:hypothetical protein